MAKNKNEQNADQNLDNENQNVGQKSGISGISDKADNVGQELDNENLFFKRYPKVAMYFETADGRKFFNRNDAINHVNTLTNKLVKEIKK